MLRGPQQGLFELVFRSPAECADLISTGAADIGIVPAIEVPRQNLEIIPGIGVASRGPVRSILLISQRPLPEIRTLAADSSSRTSVELARIVLARRYGCEPRLRSQKPDLATMLESADAALIIGDPALRIDPAALPYFVADLGKEWTQMTGLPMVFAVWAGRKQCITPSVIKAFQQSCRYGRERIDEIVDTDAAARDIGPELARQYLTQHIVNEFSSKEYEGMELFLSYAREKQMVGRDAL
jgi:chorismate dehydratase